MNLFFATRGLVLGLASVTVVLSGCLNDLGSSDSGNLSIGAGLPLYSPVCKAHSGPIVDPATGYVSTVCDLLVAKGPRPVNEPSIAINPKDPLNLIAGANDYGPGDSWAGVYVSKDGGHKWTQGYIPGYPKDTRPSPLTGHTTAGDAVIAFAPDGTAYYAGLAFRRATVGGSGTLVGGASLTYIDGASLFVARSRDGGTTWDQIVVPQIGIGAELLAVTPAQVALIESMILHDKEWITVGPDGTVYMTWTAYKFSVVAPDASTASYLAFEAPIKLTKSVDQGKTWSDPITLSSAKVNQGSVPVVAPDGTLVVAWASYGDDLEEKVAQMVVRTSHDKGATFSSPVTVATLKSVEPAHRTRTGTFPSLAVDTSDEAHRGRLGMVWAGNVTGDADVFLSQSLDAGATWTEPIRVNQDPIGNGRAQYMPFVAAAPDGTLHVVYFDGREDVRNTLIGVYVASTSDGKAFVEQAVTDAPFVADQDGFNGANFLGDYLGMAASARGVYPIWPDTRSARSATGDSDLYTVHLVASK